MVNIMKTYNIVEGVNLHLIKSNKYKDISIYFNFYNYINGDNRVKKAILTYLIGNCSTLYDDKVKMTRAKDNFYGAVIGTGNFTIGNGCIFQIIAKVLNEKFTKEKYFKEFIEFLDEIINNSLINEESFNEAKTNLKDSSKRKSDNQMSLSISRVWEIIGKDNYLKELSIISEDRIKEQKLEDLKQSYLNMINNDNLDIFVIGDFDEEQVYDLFKTKYHAKERKLISHQQQVLEYQKYDETFHEYKDTSQASLVMLFKTNITKNDPRYMSFKVANAFFGQVPASLLFQEVREKNSLCYSISSGMLSEEGLLIVKTLINKDDAKKVVEIVNEQVNRMKNGDFEDTRLNDAKILYGNTFISINDDVNNTMNYYYTNILDNKNQTIFDDYEKILSVTKDDVINSFKDVDLLLTYILQKGDQNEENL